jgi:capsular polysaccharide transport system ATP-binding protein
MIAVEEVTKIYRTKSGEHRVLDNVSFTVRQGQALGIMGRNGAGKSTLTRILTGSEYPTSGRIRREMSVSWPLAFSGGFQGSLTGADNARFIARIYGVPVERTLKFVQEFAELGEYFRMPVKTYSSGMRGRLAFGISLAVDFDCMVVDEIVAVGDQRFTQRCIEALAERRKRGALIMVSHSPDLLRKFCDTGALVSGGHITFHDSIDKLAAAYGAL